MKERYSCYEFRIKENYIMEETFELTISVPPRYVYEIYTEGCKPYDDGIIESEELFETEQEARFAAIGHIDQLENGGIYEHD